MSPSYRILGCAVALSFTTLACEPGAMRSRLDQYAGVPLTADLSGLTERERQMIPLLIEAADQMDEIFWMQAYGDRDSLLANIDGGAARRYAELNYGPWDRLAGDEPFVDGVGPKPSGASFYPADMTREEFEAAVQAAPEQARELRSLYTVVRRRPDGSLYAVPHHEAYAPQVEIAADRLRQAAALAENPGLKRYLELRAQALLTDEYRESDLAWLDMKDNTLEVVIGPIETYEDQLFGYKAAYEAVILVKDNEWSQRLAFFATFLEDLQGLLPVPDRYKREMPASQGELHAYDALYYAGDANAGPKTIAINLPNDETVQLEKGTRRLQLKNAMRAKFEQILAPTATLLIAEDQRRYVTFDAFFQNTMFHEVAHGLGSKNTVNRRGTVRQALRETAAAMEEGKADVLGLYMMTWLRLHGVLSEGNLWDNYATFVAGILRSVRFGASSAHAKANMVGFNFFAEQGAITRDEASGTYRVDFEKMMAAMEALARRLLTIQGDGDYEAAVALLTEQGIIGPTLQADLDRLATAGIPVDVVFQQGRRQLGF